MIDKSTSDEVQFICAVNMNEKLRHSVCVFSLDDATASSAENILAAQNYHVQRSTSAQDTLELLQNKTVDCLLFDSATAVDSDFNEIMKRYPDCHQCGRLSIVMILDRPTMKQLKIYHQTGIRHFLHKPLNAYELSSLVGNAILLNLYKLSWDDNTNELERLREENQHLSKLIGKLFEERTSASMGTIPNLNRVQEKLKSINDELDRKIRSCDVKNWEELLMRDIENRRILKKIRSQQ